MRQLALRLSRQGLYVVRFDYYATGNSAGPSQQLSVKTCVNNINDVSRFIADYSESEKITYIGLRLGAALALMGSLQSPPDQLVMWDPVINGKDFLAELEVLHEKFLDKMKRGKSHEHNLGREYLGYPYSEGIIEELSRIQLEGIDVPGSTALSILTSPDNIEQQRYVEALMNTRPQIRHEETTSWPVNSEDISTLDSSFLPSQSIGQICNFLKAVE